MPKFVVEREIPGAGTWTSEQLEKASRKSNEVLAELGGDVQWMQSYVTGEKLYCVYVAADAERIREHARRGGFPADAINEVAGMIAPTTGGR